MFEPMQEPHRITSGEVTQSPLVLTDVITEEGIIGHSMVFIYTPAALKPTADLIQNIETLIKGNAIAPIEIEQELAKQFRLLGTKGLVGMAAIDSFKLTGILPCEYIPPVHLRQAIKFLFNMTALNQ